jgi:hypothetical protein
MNGNEDFFESGGFFGWRQDRMVVLRMINQRAGSQNSFPGTGIDSFLAERRLLDWDGFDSWRR